MQFFFSPKFLTVASSSCALGFFDCNFGDIDHYFYIDLRLYHITKLSDNLVISHCYEGRSLSEFEIKEAQNMDDSELPKVNFAIMERMQ